MPEVSQDMMDILIHATDAAGETGQPGYRNYYYPNNSELQLCRKLEEEGLMVERKVSYLEDQIFIVTSKGKEVAFEEVARRRAQHKKARKQA
jgi:hypothetical protein